jgi:muconate cycloisomerase
MRIAGVETIRFRLPRRRVHRTSFSIDEGGDPIGTYVLVKLTSDTGRVGWGEAPVLIKWGGDHMKYYGESTTTTEHVIKDYLAPVLVGADPLNLEPILFEMDRRVKGYPYAKAAVDTALYDLIGQHLNVPVYQLLGGARSEWVLLCHSIGIMPIDEAVREACEVVAQGVKVIKLKVGINPEHDVALVRQVREAVGPELRLTLDANQGYATAYEAIRTIRAIQPYDIQFVEQPVQGLDEMARVARAVDVPLMADESAWTPQDIIQINQLEAARIVSLYTTKAGGMYNAKKVAAVCEATNIVCNVNGSIESGVGNAANLHLACSTRVVRLASVLPVTTPAGQGTSGNVGLFYLDDIVTEAFEYKDGALRVPQGPGLGVKVDLDKLQQYAL